MSTVITVESKAERLRRHLLPPFEPGSAAAGARDMAMPGVAIGAWGVVTGVAMVKAGLTVPMALLMTLLAYAGSAQLAVLPLLMVSAPLPVVWATALMVNLRFLIFSAANRHYFSSLPWQQRLLASYVNGDVGFAVFMRRYGTADVAGTPEQWGFFFGGAVVSWLSWQLSSYLGIVIGDALPSDWGFELAASLALVAVVVPLARGRAALAGVAVSGLVAVVTIDIPYRIGVVISVLAGVAVALCVERLATPRVTQ